MKVIKFIPFIAIILLVWTIWSNGFSSITETYVETDFDTFLNTVQTSQVENVSISLTKLTASTVSESGNTFYQTANPHSDELLNVLKSSNLPITYDYTFHIMLGIFAILIICFVILGIVEHLAKKNKKLFNKINNQVPQKEYAPGINYADINTFQNLENNRYARKHANKSPYNGSSSNKNTSGSSQQRQQTSRPQNVTPSNNADNQATQMTTLSNKKLAPNRIKVKFADVAGVDEAKLEVQEVVDFLKNPQRFISFGIRVPKGVILYGQPGTGKTLLAKAIAGEANVPFFSLSGSDFAEMYVGVGAARVRNLFKEARENKPCIIFIDEIDALARKRGASHNSNEEKDQTLNQLLVEMDGFAENDGIVLIGATNRLDILDPAVLRPGRFDRHVEVPVPDKNGRLAILKIHAKNKKLDKTINLSDVANKTTGFSGAELENVLNEAGLLALRKNQNVIMPNDIEEAISKVMVGLKKMKNNLSAKEKKIVAYHEAGHAIATKLLAKKVVEKITILPTNKSLGYVMRGNEDEQFLDSKEELFNSICIALAGRAAEKIYFSENNITNGASNDLQKATSIAREMVFSYGMSSLGNISLSESFKDNGASISDSMKDKAYEEVQKILNKADSTVTNFLRNNSTKLEQLVKVLMEKETLYKADVDKILSGTNNQKKSQNNQGTNKSNKK